MTGKLTFYCGPMPGPGEAIDETRKLVEVKLAAAFGVPAQSIHLERTRPHKSVAPHGASKGRDGVGSA